MKSTDELFANDGSDDLYDIFVELDCRDGVDPQDRSPERLRVLFEGLPQHIRDIAHQWSLTDTVFRDEAFSYYEECPRSAYAP